MPKTRIQIRIAIGAVVAAVALGCGPAAPPPGDVVMRWIDTDPESVITASDLLASRFSTEVGPTSTAAVEKWRGNDVRIHGFSDGALEFEQDGEDPWLATIVDLEADATLAIEIELTNPGPGEAQIFWAGRWQRFSTRRMERAINGRHLDSSTIKYRFEVGDNPEWRGSPRSLRFDVPPGAAGRMRLGAVRIFRGETDEGLAASATTRPWKVDLGESARNALLSPPGTSWDRRLKVPARASLVLSYGLQPAIQQPVVFRVVADEEGKDPVVVFEDRIRADRSRAGRWHDAVIDLGEFSGREVWFRLVTDAATDYNAVRGYPVWANPEVVAPNPGQSPPNVVVVVLDTLRADRLSSYGHPIETSPQMDRWASESAVRFANVVAPAPWTLPAHASLFTGLDALRHGFNFWGTAPPTLEMLAEILRRHGYSTAAVTGGGILHPDFGFAQGFDVYDYWPVQNSEQEVGWVFERARRWIEDHSQRRFFLFVHTYEMHAPHRRRQPYFAELARAAGVTPADFDLDLVTFPWENLIAPGDHFVVEREGAEGWTADLTADEITTVGLMYDSALATVDDEVGRLLDHIRGLGLSGRTLVVVTSDHGEALGEDGRAGHAYLDDYNLMVPLILELPGASNAGAVVDTQVRLIDIAPTVLDVVGIEPAGPVDGRSLLPLLDNASADFPREAWAYAASSNHGLAMRLDNSLKYRFPDPAWAEVAHREALYDLESDPDEDHNLAPGDARLDALRATTRDTILAQHQGIRLEIRNAGDGILEGRLNGAWAAHDRVKTSSHLDDAAHWKAGSTATFQLEPGNRTTLLFTQLTASEVGLEVWADGIDGTKEIATHTIFDLAVLETPAALHLVEDGWRLDEEFTGTIETGFLITRIGDTQPIVSGPVPTDAEILEQLEALGYIQ